MTRQIVISGETYGRLCEIASLVKMATGRAVTFGEVVDSLLEAGGHAA